jgi:hypothetical protein
MTGRAGRLSGRGYARRRSPFCSEGGAARAGRVSLCPVRHRDVRRYRCGVSLVDVVMSPRVASPATTTSVCFGRLQSTCNGWSASSTISTLRIPGAELLDLVQHHRIARAGLADRLDDIARQRADCEPTVFLGKDAPCTRPILDEIGGALKASVPGNNKKIPVD